MLTRLRRTFVAAIMGVLALVLTVVFALVCYFDWQGCADEAESLLSSALAQAPGAGAPTGAPEGRFPSLGSLPDAPQEPAPPRIDLAVAVYELSDGRLQHVPESRGMLSEVLASAAQEAIAHAPDGMGVLEDLGLVYLKVERGGTASVAFADASILDGWKALLVTLALIEAVVLVVFLFVAMAFARWALKPVEVAWAKQRAFVADASHELKTPLSIIAANTAILLEEPQLEASERTRWLTSTLDATQGMRTLVDDMLDLASLEAGEGASEDADGANARAEDTEPCDLSRMALACALQFEAVAYERGFAMEEDIDEGILVIADADALRKVLGILMDNACKYVEPGGTVTTSVSALSATEACMRIGNTGTPIPPEDLERVFDRFYRGDPARTSGTGHGLGLSIAQELAKRMGGTLTAQSDEGTTVFSLVLRRA